MILISSDYTISFGKFMHEKSVFAYIPSRDISISVSNPYYLSEKHHFFRFMDDNVSFALPENTLRKYPEG